jgi:hypothetical protein
LVSAGIAIIRIDGSVLGGKLVSDIKYSCDLQHVVVEYRPYTAYCPSRSKTVVGE